ncbi:hypothetical protein BDF14DRAFT_619367 [Spinellus fusiger]|nr:hypothetical protein BDF14DRAFT_619367 [Spinellus fusiger]
MKEDKRRVVLPWRMVFLNRPWDLSCRYYAINGCVLPSIKSRIRHCRPLLFFLHSLLLSLFLSFPHRLEAKHTETDFEDSLGGAWYITPTHHAIEFITLAPIFLLLTGFFGWRAFRKGLIKLHCCSQVLYAYPVVSSTALVFPDLRDHDMFGEVFNFFLEHILILGLPFFLLWTGRYVILPASIDMALFSFFLYAAYHSPLLHILSLSSGYNLNYTLVPPALGFLIAVGPWYRFVMYGTALVNMFWTRYLFIGKYVEWVCKEIPSQKKVQ